MRYLAKLPELIAGLQTQDDHTALKLQQRKLPLVIKYVQRLEDDMQWLTTLLARQRSLFDELTQ